MKIVTHIEKFRRLDDALGRLRSDADCELWVWTAMNACVNLLNASLHQADLTDATDSFHTQVEGLYARPDRVTGILTDAMHAPGDVMHAGQPSLAKPLPDSIARASTALAFIENLREPFVRGSDAPSAGSTAEWERAYRTCVQELCGVLDVAVRQ
jgi:hypothetical protein